MANNEPQHSSDWRTALAIALIAVGLLLVVASVIMPASAAGGTNWSPEQAKQYQAASVKLHSLSHTAATRHTRKAAGIAKAACRMPKRNTRSRVPTWMRQFAALIA